MRYVKYFFQDLDILNGKRKNEKQISKEYVLYFMYINYSMIFIIYLS